MALRIDEREDLGATTWVHEWPFAARSHFIESTEYDTFVRELRRYVRGEVPGRSFLISGHRGAGKTSLVRHAVEELTRSIIVESADQADRLEKSRIELGGEATDRMLDQQRPLLVRLHGPSLLGTQSAAGAALIGDARQPPAPDDATTVALQQITIQLYRALAAEFGKSFANHARDQIHQSEKRGRGKARVVDRLELAAQFVLELDNIPAPAVLRDFYRHLGRLHSGVLWPQAVGKALRTIGLNDRGVREIVALATAAQAFKVCVGKVGETKTAKQSTDREASAESTATATLKDVVSKLLALAAGIGVGVGAGMTPGIGTASGAILGVAAAALTAFTLTWTSKRSAKASQSVDYSFILDHTKQSLERDLPQVVQRIREAGLAPVFVIDELDKLDKPTEQIAALIKRLKHLTTDLGCFCFLTDRDYFEHVLRKVRVEAFPQEHTFFSHLLFILPRPKEFLSYFNAITRLEPDPSGVSAAEAARSIFGYFVLHRSKLNMADVMRDIAMRCHPDGKVRPSDVELQKPEYLLAASIQIVIGVVLERDAMRQRAEAEPRFMQWSIDSLYLLSRAWERQDRTVKLNRKSIVQGLLLRGGRTGVPDDQAEDALLNSGMGLIDLDIIDQHVDLFTSLLCDRAALLAELSTARQADLAKLLLPFNLVRAVADADREFEFLFDVYGEELRDRLEEAEIREALDYLLEFEAMLGDLGLSIGDLVELQVLPSSIAVAELALARDRLASVIKQKAAYGLFKDLTLVGLVRNFVAENGRLLSELLVASLQVGADARVPGQEPGSLRRAIEGVLRYTGGGDPFQDGKEGAPLLTRIAERPPDDLEAVVLSGDLQSVRAWRTAAARRRSRLMSDAPRLDEALVRATWVLWEDRIRRYVVDGTTLIDPPHYSDMLCFAANSGPGPFFRRDLGMMSLAEWSEFCLAGFPMVGRSPAWTFVAGLCVLGFSYRVVLAAVSEFGQSGPLIDACITQAPETEVPGYILLMLPAASMGSKPVSPSDEAILALPTAKADTYIAAIDWLESQGALSAKIEEEAG
jgi:hypothetical protein